MRIPNFLLAACMLVSCFSFNARQKEKIHWLTVQEYNDAFAKAPRPVLIDLYTDWCGWCKVMDRKTYTHQKLINYVNEHFYAVRFNAESREPVSFNSKSYEFDARTRTNNLAVYLTRGQLAYPSTVILSRPDLFPILVQGYTKPAELEPLLKFIGEGANQRETLTTFSNKTKMTW